MVIRFDRTFALPQQTIDAVNKTYLRTVGAEGMLGGDGKLYTVFTLKQHIYLLPNLDLFIDDSLPEDISGEFMKVMRCFDFLGEQSEMIVPPVRDRDDHRP